MKILNKLKYMALIVVLTTLGFFLTIGNAKAQGLDTNSQSCPYPITTTVCDQYGCKLVTVWVYC